MLVVETENMNFQEKMTYTAKKDAPTSGAELANLLVSVIYYFNTKRQLSLVAYSNLDPGWNPTVYFKDVLIDLDLLPNRFSELPSDDILSNIMYMLPDRKDALTSIPHHLRMEAVVEKILGVSFEHMNVFFTKEEYFSKDEVQQVITMFITDLKICVRFLIDDIAKYEHDIHGSFFNKNDRYWLDTSKLTHDVFAHVKDGQDYPMTRPVALVLEKYGFELVNLKYYMLELLI
jgi:hypothetical protein